MDKCANCDRQIGKLEAAHVWKNNIVCDECNAKLRKPEIHYATATTPDAGASMPPDTDPKHFRAPPPLRTAKRVDSNKPAKKQVGCVTGTLAVVGSMILMCCVWGFIMNDPKVSNSSAPAPTAPKAPMFRNGETAFLDVGSGTCLLAVRDDDLSAMLRAVRIKDDAGLAQMVLENKIFGAENGTRVMIIDRGIMSTTVRVQEGVTAGRAGIVPNELLRK